MRRRLGVLALLVSASACALPAPFTTTRADLVTGAYGRPAGRSGEFVVASYNIRYGEDIDRAIADLRDDARLRDAEVLLLQEMDPEGCERVARALGYDFAYFPAAISPHHGRLFGNAILARGAVRNPRFIQLPTPGPISGTKRIAVVAEVDLGGRSLTAVSLHASTMILPQELRTRQFRVLAESLRAVRGPVVIAGDFNTVTNDDTLRAFRELRRGGLARVALDEPTIPPKASRFFRYIGLLDNVFYRGLDPVDAGVVSRARASDHYPVWARFRWEDS